MPILRAYLRLVGRWRWSLLLALLIGSLLMQPLWPASGLADLARLTLALLILGGAIYAGRSGPWLRRGVLATLMLAFLLELMKFLGIPGLEGVLAGAALVIVAGAMIATFAELVGDRSATPDGLIGAIFGYFLIAAAWALLFRQLEVWRPGSFHLGEGPHDAQLLYFSLITITTVGYGDVLPVTPIARIWAALEASVGTLYIAILIGRIVGELRFDRAAEAGRGRTATPPAAPTKGKSRRRPVSRPGR